MVEQEILSMGLGHLVDIKDAKVLR